MAQRSLPIKHRVPSAFLHRPSPSSSRSSVFVIRQLNSSTIATRKLSLSHLTHYYSTTIPSIDDSYEPQGNRSSLPTDLQASSKIYSNEQEQNSNSLDRSESSSSKPWFVDDPPEPDLLPNNEVDRNHHDQTIDLSTSTSPTLPPPSRPSNLPLDLEELYQHLIQSPFLDHPTITFIDAKSHVGDSAWTDWVILVTLKLGRERSIQGAAEAIKSVLEKSMNVRIEGTRSSNQSSHSSWIMVDGGKVVIHVLNQESRQIYDIESVWKNPS